MKFTFIKAPSILLSVLLLFSCTSNTPLKKAERLANRIIDETKFETEEAVVQPIDRIQVIDFNIVHGEDIIGLGIAKNTIISPIDTTLLLGVSYSIPFTIQINNKIVFEQMKSSKFVFREKAYGMYDFQDTMSVRLNKGENNIFINAHCDTESKLYLREITFHNADPILKFGDQNDKQNWQYSGIQNIENSVSVRKILKNKNFEKSIKDWQNYPTLYYDKLLLDESNTYKRESYIEWHYAIGTTMLGLINLNEELNSDKISAFVKKYCDYNLEMRDSFRQQYIEKHALRVASYRNLRKAMLDDTGPATIPYTYLYNETNDDKYLPIIREMADYISNGQMRLEDGTLCRPEPVDNTIWADDLYMSCQLLLRVYGIEKDPKYLEDVLTQILNFDKYLWDDSMQLLKHARMGDKEEKSEIYWSRANGWVNWTLSDALQLIPNDHPSYDVVLKIYQKVMAGIVKYQSDTGLWHQVIDREDSFKETSSSAMFTLAIARGVSNGWLPEEYKKYALLGWQGISGNISDDGIVKDICRGTGIGHTFEFYNTRERFDNDPRGLGAVLTAATEIIKLKK